MIQLQPIINSIRALLEENTEASVTYAALEARLAIEKVCYDRLRQRHDYISHDELRKWQPGAVIRTLMRDVDAHVAETITLSISKTPATPDVALEDENYVNVGTEVGFDVYKIVKMWNAVSKLALHVQLPKARGSAIPAYGEKEKIAAKVSEILVELERLSKGTMIFSGLGMEVSFVCDCGTENKRRASLLRDGQHVFCINPNCKFTWKAMKGKEGFAFEAVAVHVDCDRCQADNLIPWRFVTGMKYDELASFSCHTCGHKNLMKWQLMQAREEPTEGGS